MSCGTEFCYRAREKDQSKAFPEIICDQRKLRQESQGDRTITAGEEKHSRERKAQVGVVEEEEDERERRSNMTL